MSKKLTFLDDEENQELEREFPDLQSRNAFSMEEVQKALKVLGAPLPGHEIRNITEKASGDTMSTASRELALDAFGDLFKKAKKMNDNSSHIRKSELLKEAQEVQKIQGQSEAKHTYSESEERGFTNWINKHLGDDDDCKEAGDIPLSLDQNELFTKTADGVILCKIINKAVPNTIDERTINKGKSLKLLFKRNENLTLAINSAAAVGCCVTNIGPGDIGEGKPHIILGLIWQLIRKVIVDSINLSSHNELAALLLPGETLEDLSQMKPEELLQRWVNFQLERSGCDRRMNNFNEDIYDSEIYAHLLNQIAPDHLKGGLVSHKNILQDGDLTSRANYVCQNAAALDCGSFLSPETIYEANIPEKRNDRLHLAFVATLFNQYPALDSTTGDAANIDIEVYQENLEEKTYRNWMNSLGVKPYVNHLYTGVSDGLIFLQLIDIIEEGTVDQARVTKKYDPKREIFQKQANCSLVVEYGKKIGLKMVNISGEDIRNQSKKLVLGACFQMMQKYLYKLLKQIGGSTSGILGEEKEILAWANKMLAESDEKPNPLSSFRDKALITSIPIAQLLNSIRPETCDRSLYNDDHFSNAVYTLSVARKSGAKVYALPEHVAQLDGKMIFTIFVCIMIVYYQRQSVIED